jgi:uncharacterized protein (TIGR03083 family)
MDLVLLYTDAQARVFDLVSALSAVEQATFVPGTPRWTVIQLIAHLSGIATDMAEGRTEGAATAPWTARQIAEREGRSLADLLDEWRMGTGALLEMLATPGRVDAAAFDLLTHEHDLRGALGISGASSPSDVLAVATRVTGRLNVMVERAELPALRLVHDDGEWVCGPGEAAACGTATTMEWFRALFGRRSAAQVLTYDWDGDPSPYFELLNLFGPLPASDVAEAGAPLGAGSDA